MYSPKNHFLAIQELKKYEEVKYGDLQKTPQKYENVEKIVIDLEFVGEMESKSPYERAFLERNYYFLRIPSAGEEDNYDYNNNSYNGGTLVPFLISKMKRGNTIDYIVKFEKKTPIKVFGDLKVIPKPKGLDQKYYFIVDDVLSVAEYEEKMKKKEEVKVAEKSVKEIPTEESEATEEGEKSKEKSEAKKPVEEEAQGINPKNLDLLAGKYEGKRISFNTVYKGRKSAISSLSDKFPGEKYFELEGLEEVKLPKFFVIVEKNETNIQKFTDVEEGQEVEISGTLQKLEKNGEVIYYIID